MEIKKVNTFAFAVSEERGGSIERKLSHGKGGLFGGGERPEVKRGYFPLVIYKLSRVVEAHKGLMRQSTYEKRENYIFVNMNNGLFYFLKGKEIQSFGLLNTLMDARPEVVLALGDLILHGEKHKEDLDTLVVMELMHLGLIQIYKPRLKETLTLFVDEVFADTDDGRHIRHTIVKDRIKKNFHIPFFDNKGYDLTQYLKTTNTMLESYVKEPIKQSVDHMAEILKCLFDAKVSVDGVVFMPYLECFYHDKRNHKKERISEFRFPVAFNNEKCTIKEGVPIKPIALSMEVGSTNAIPIERETIDFTDVSGMEEIKKVIREEIIYPVIRPDLAKEYGRKGGGGILLYGPPGCGKTFIAKATIGECGADFYNINISDLVKKGFQEGARSLHEIFEQASSNPPAIIFFDELDAIGGTRDSKQAQSERLLINQLLTEMDGVESIRENVLFIAATNAPWAIDPALRRSGRFTRQLLVPPPDREARIGLLKHHTKKEPVSQDVNFERIAELTDGYSSADIKAICDAAAKTPWEEALEKGIERDIVMQDFMKAIAKQKSSLLAWYKSAYKSIEESGEWDGYEEFSKYIMKYAGGVDLVKKPDISFKDVGNLRNVKEEIKKSVIYPMLRQDLAEEFGKTVGGGILLYGPPGCGKTYIAKATAGECNASFFNVGITDILSAQKGESEKKLRDVFERASRNTPSIIFFDEIEALAGRRDKLEGSDRSLVNELLTELDGFKKKSGLVIIAATNEPWAVDPALRRSERFTKELFIPPPNFEARVEIFKIHSAAKPLNDDIDFIKLADETENYTSSDIKAICDTAAEIPWGEALKGAPERKITMNDFMEAINKTKSSLTSWIKMAKKELESSGESEIYCDLYTMLSNYNPLRKEEYKDLIEEERLEKIHKFDTQLKHLEDEKEELMEKIRMAQRKYYKREISEDNFKDIIKDYEKLLIDADLRIRKLKSKREEFVK